MKKRSSASKQIKKYSLIVGLLVFIASFLFGYINLKNIEKGKKTAATYTAQSTVRRINAQLNQYVELSEFLGNVVLAGYNLDQTSFSELAKMLPNEDGIVKAFELAPDGVVTDVFPQQGNENAFGINMLTDHERKDDANRAKETGNYTLGGPYKLKQGGTGALLFHPVYKEDSIDNDSFWGFVIMVIDWDKFIDEIGLDRLNEASYCYEIWTTDETTGSRVVLTQSQEHIPKNSLTVECEIPNDTWYVDIVPDEGWISIYQWIAVIAVSCITSLMGATIFNQVRSKKYRENQYAVELKKSAEQAREASEAKTRFLFNMSHDIRTPINGICGMINVADHYADNMEKQTECRAKIKKTSHLLLELINEVLDMSKLESDEVVLEDIPFNLNSIFEEILGVIEHMAAEQNIRIIWEEKEVTHWNLIGSPVHVKRILMNILSNAVKYNKENGYVYISCREIPSKQTAMPTLEFVCRDTGIGMTEAFQKRIFEPFAQEHAGSRTKFAGTGLGMPITKKLVEKMGGTISFESKEGTGTTFVIRIPFQIDADMKDRNETEEKTETSIQGLHVLLTEDNELNMEIAEFVLQNEGAVVTKAWNGQKAVDIFRKNRPGEFDVILMDIMMPVMNGYEAAKMIRSLDREDAKVIPIIAMTANAFTEDKMRAKEAGMDEHIAKPVDGKLLVKVINELVKRDQREKL